MVGIGVEGAVYDQKTPNPFSLPSGVEWPASHVLKVYHSAKNAEKEWERAQQLRALQLPGIILPEHRIVLPDGRIALSMPYGGTALSAVGTEMDRGRLQHKMHQFIDDIADWNSKGVFHNDLHPGNLVYDGDRVRAIDWGYAEMPGLPSGKPRAFQGPDRDYRGYAEAVKEALRHSK